MRQNGAYNEAEEPLKQSRNVPRRKFRSSAAAFFISASLREADLLAKVVTAALIRRDDRILIMRRRHKTMNGKWEFPGGKLEEGESEKACLERELFEELGITGKTGDFFSESLYRYEFGEILLRAYWFSWEEGEIQLRVHDRLCWALPQEMTGVDFSAADLPIARKIQEASCLKR